MRFHVETFGCRANQADAAALIGELRVCGHQQVSSPELADLVILNTCTVTSAADRQAQERIRQLHRLHPGGGILVTGCYAQRAPGEVAALPGVTCVVGNSHKSEIPRLLEQPLPVSQFIPLEVLTSQFTSTLAAPSMGELTLADRPSKIIKGDMFAEATPSAAQAFAGDRTRPILKIQDGCNHRCAYCVIPFVRGRSRSLPPEAVLEAIRGWVAAGVQEVVLSGIDLGSYGCDLKPRTTLRALTERILAETALPLLRFSSIEPADLTSEFLRLFAAADRIARHIHAPLQSGSNRILRRMYRPYRAEDYAARILEAAEQLPNVGIGADIIVGFPGESEQDFAATCKLAERLPLSYLHVFSFSKRPGTRAWHLTDGVRPATIRERARALRALATEKQRAFLQAQVGRSLKVLPLKRIRPDGRREALAENYLKVVLADSNPAPNQLLLAQVFAVEGDRLLARPVAARPAA